MRSSYMSGGPRSLPHMNSKRLPNNHRLSPPTPPSHGAPMNNTHAMNSHGMGPHNMGPHGMNSHGMGPHGMNSQGMGPPHHVNPHSNNQHNNNTHGNNNHTSQHDDLICYIYESWNKVSREFERGEQVRYYHEPPRNLANFTPFNLDHLWGRRVVLNRKHRS